MNLISHGQAASNGYFKNFKTGSTCDTRNGRRKGSSEFYLIIKKNDFNSFIVVKS